MNLRGVYREGDEHGILATSPLICGTAGTLDHAVVLRGCDLNASQVADDPSNPRTYVVHDMVISENGKTFFTQGSYFPVSGDGKEALRDAVSCWHRRTLQRMMLDRE